ncbi:hypothetical protein MauCBS54593_000044 [Microsporum audouinii]
MLSENLSRAFSQTGAMDTAIFRNPFVDRMSQKNTLIGFLVTRPAPCLTIFLEPQTEAHPGIGHIRGFVANSQELLTRARLYFGDTREPFAITIANQLFYIITNSNDVSSVFRNSTSLTFEIFAQEILHDLGCSESSIKQMYGDPDPTEAGSQKPHTKSPSRMARDFHHHQLFPGGLLDTINIKFIQYFKRSLDLEYLTSQPKYATRIASDAVQVSLFEMSSDLFTNAAQDVYFGKLLRKIAPDLAYDLLEYDDLAWQVLFRYPRFLSTKMVSARNRVFDGLEKYFASPTDERQDTVWFTPTLEKEMRNAGLNNRDIAIMMMTIYWGLSTNTRKSVFWVLAYIIFDAELMATIRREVSAAFEGEKIDVDHITENCPRLRGVWDETLRTTAFSSSVRYVAEDTVIGNKILRKGHRIMMPYRQLHLDESIFGERVAEFDSERFVKDTQLRRYNMGFGGGATQCPGRHLARQVVMVFAAMLVYQFDVALDPPDQEFPKAEEKIPVLGIIGIKTDLSLSLTKRDSSKI